MKNRPYYEFNHGAFLRLLFESGLTTRVLSEKSGVRAPLISTITNDSDKKPSRVVVAKLARAFGVDYTALLIKGDDAV